uniref:protein-tyrosine-phosphatase n=1 Tax=Dracunculus medinensis TaxID=318479 RepID=A0A158Q2W1_DRAME
LEDDFDISYNAESTTESNLSVLILKLSSTHEFRRKRDTIGVSSFPTTDLAVISSSLPPDVVKQYSAMKLQIPECEDSTNDCAYGGKCVAAPDGYKSCLCPASCPVSIPVSCRAEKQDDYCMSMSDDYREKYSLPDPALIKNLQGICVCPPMFDPWKMEGSVNLLPFKCDRRELKVQGVAIPSDSVYQGTDAILFCCINMDPRTFVNDDGVDFIQNSSIIREPTNTPYDELFTDGFEPPRCWSLDIKNAQFSDSGSYLCHVKTIGRHEIPANFTIEFVVKEHRAFRPMVRRLMRRRTTAISSSITHSPFFSKIYRNSTSPTTTSTKFRPRSEKKNSTIDAVEEETPRMIQNITVKANATHAEIHWDTQEGPMLKINFKLLRRTDGVEVWAQKNAKPGVVISNLLPATPYTLFISVFDGQNDPFKITEQFTTAESAPEPPTLGEIRILNLRDGLKCEVEWTPPKTPNGRIIKYYVTVRGIVRYAPHGILSGDDFPLAERDRCANFNGDEKSFTTADAIADFYSCRFGPLKPNRNYTATVWAVNGAGKSRPISFSDSCVTNFAQPDSVDAPLSSTQNGSSFALSFGSEPDQTNGPVSCYYIAIVPLHTDVAIEEIPAPDSLVVDTFLKTLENNLLQDDPSKSTKKFKNRRYFAYIAESYANFPRHTMIGDGNTTADVDPCNVFYLSRHRPEDPALRPGLKYTGFMIVRVDRDDSSRDEILRHPDNFHKRRLKRYWFSYREESELTGRARSSRQLIIRNFAQSWMTIAFTTFSLFIFILIVCSVVTYFLHKRGLIKQLCPINKDRTLLRPQFHATPIEDLPAEFIIRHRDSNFLFISEFEALPHYHRSYESSASERRENSHKNRYNDIKAFDSTRVKLSVVNADPSTDYINANFIKGYKGQKTFIATQGPVDASIDDFWRMVWEHNVQLIVMVANLYERSRCQCSKYWPDDVSKIYDKIEVRPIDSTFYSDYAIRTFEIQKIAGSTIGNGITTGQPAVISYEASSDDNGHSGEPVAVIINKSRAISTKGSVESILNSDYANIPSDSNRNSRSSNNLRLGTGETEFVTRSLGIDCRKVVQYHYTSWNDLQAPECTTGLLRFLKKLRNLKEFNSSPVVVHCSAGVGRTGTFIALDSLLDQCIEEGKADVFGFVSEMRKQRNIMVQNYEQYVFIYKALAEWYMFGETDVSIDKFPEYYRSLKEIQRDKQSFNASANIASLASVVLKSTTPRLNRTSSQASSSDKTVTAMEAEFKRLDRSLELNRTCNFAHKPENANKNRFENAVPFDQCRVILSIVIGSHTDTTYINASLVKGYFYPYILAQDPIDEQTCYDFWRMIGDQNSKVVVMLSSESEFSVHEKYWAIEIGKSISFGHDADVSIKLISEEIFPTFILRKFTYKFVKEKNYREVVQFSYLCWATGNLVPISTDSLIDLISRVLSLQSDHQEAGPIILHSRDGSSETGLFCCVSLLLERLKAESRIDVFQTVRSLQQNRPLLFKKFEQYAFCYKAVMDYLDSFSENAQIL